MCSPHLRGEASTCGVLATDHLRGDRRRICGMRYAHLRGESKHLRGAYDRLPARWSWTYLRGVSSAFVAFWHLRGVCLRDHHHGDSACYMRAERACKPRHVSICISKHSICFDARFEHNIYMLILCMLFRFGLARCMLLKPSPFSPMDKRESSEEEEVSGDLPDAAERNRIRRERKSGRRA